jgi:hypothetical protein
MPAIEAVRLLVLAERFAYSRMTPTMSWDRIARCAQDIAPGLIEALRAQYGDRAAPDLVDEAFRAVDQIGSRPAQR